MAAAAAVAAVATLDAQTATPEALEARATATDARRVPMAGPEIALHASVGHAALGSRRRDAGSGRVVRRGRGARSAVAAVARRIDASRRAPACHAAGSSRAACAAAITAAVVAAGAAYRSSGAVAVCARSNGIHRSVSATAACTAPPRNNLVPATAACTAPTRNNLVPATAARTAPTRNNLVLATLLVLVVVVRSERSERGVDRGRNRRAPIDSILQATINARLLRDPARLQRGRRRRQQQQQRCAKHLALERRGAAALAVVHPHLGQASVGRPGVRARVHVAYERLRIVRALVDGDLRHTRPGVGKKLHTLTPHRLRHLGQQHHVLRARRRRQGRRCGRAFAAAAASAAVATAAAWRRASSAAAAALRKRLERRRRRGTAVGGRGVGGVGHAADARKCAQQVDHRCHRRNLGGDALRRTAAVGPHKSDPERAHARLWQWQRQVHDRVKLAADVVAAWAHQLRAAVVARAVRRPLLGRKRVVRERVCRLVLLAAQDSGGLSLVSTMCVQQTQLFMWKGEGGGGERVVQRRGIEVTAVCPEAWNRGDSGLSRGVEWR
eukprot:40645-Chlamydomonas_euryale.AAC.1